MKKHNNLFFLSICLALLLFIPMSASATSSTNYTYAERENGDSSSNSSWQTAESLPYNTISVQGRTDVTNYDTTDCYKLTLPENGKLTFTFNCTSSNPESLDILFYKANDEESIRKVWTGAVWDKVTSYNRTLYLTSGEYYIGINLNESWPYTDIEGHYTLDLSYTPIDNAAITNHTLLENALFLESSETYTALGTPGQTYAYHTLKLDDPGIVNLKISSSSAQFQCTGYLITEDANGNMSQGTQCSYDIFSKETDSDKYGLNATLYLDKGSYTFVFRDAYSDSIEGFEYNIGYTFQPVKGVPTRPLTWEDPYDLDFDKEALGFVSQLNSPNKYYYKIILPSSGLLDLNFNKLMNTNVNDYNSNHIITIYEEELDSNGNRVSITQETENLYLEKGTYYIEIDKNRGYRGSYSLTPSFTSSNTSFEGNNLLETAVKIYPDEKITGQLSLNDKQDVYFFEINEGQDLSVEYTNNLSAYSSYFLYDVQMNVLSSVSFAADEVGKTYSGKWILGTLDAGKYYIVKNNYFYGSMTAETVGTYQFRLISNNNEPEHIRTESITLNKTELSLAKGKTYTLKATITPSNAEDTSVTWSSSNSNIATVNNKGVITAKSTGQTTITVTTNDTGKTATCVVYVTNPVKTTKVTLNKSTLSLVKGKTYTLKATVSPSNATNKTVSWKSNNTKVATVSSTGKITARGYGKATITVTTKDTGKKKTCVVTVKPSVPQKFALKKNSKNVNLSWNKISDVTGYKIYRSTKKNSGYKLVKTIKKPSTVKYSVKISSLKKNTTYYYKIVAYKTVKINGKKVTLTSNYSSYVKVKR